MKKRGKKLLACLLAAGLLLQPFSGVHRNPSVAEAAVVSGTITDIYTDKAMYQPGDTVQVTVKTENAQSGSVKLQARHLNQAVGEAVVTKISGTDTVTVEWTAPSTDFQGYLLEAYLYDAQGKLADTEAVGVNVSSTWVKFPIYGYIYDFGKDVDTEGLIEQMAKYHINGIEYYDWHYRHHQPLPSTSTAGNLGSWTDWMGRTIYGDTVKSYINAAKANGMASMAYDMIYAFTDDLRDRDSSVDNWRIKFKEDRSPNKAGDYFNYDMNPYSENKNDTLYFVNPLNEGWQNYFFAQLNRMIQEMGFDGYHGDTVGDWGPMTDNNGGPLGYEGDQPLYVVADTYTQFLNACKDAIGDAYLSFNPVGAKGIQKVNVSKTDVLYTEFWPWDRSRYDTEYKTYAAIAHEVEDSMNDSKEQSIDGKGKSLQVKAYINYKSEKQYVNDPTALLLEATAFAAGGARLELGNGEHMLTNEYYPDDHVLMSDTLKAKVRNMYDFAVAYENLLRDGQETTGNRVVLDRLSSGDGASNTIWTYTRKDSKHEVLHLINLLGTDNEWRDELYEKTAPTAVQNVRVKYYNTNEVNSIYLASPDQYDGRSYSLQFVKGEDENGRYVEFTVPSLEYWDMIYMSAETETKIVLEDAPAKKDSFVLEAEAGIRTSVGGSPAVENHTDASGSKYVHDIGLKQGYVTLTVPETIPHGYYNLGIKYSSSTNGSMSVTIDGTEYVLDYALTAHDWKFAVNTLVLEGIELSGGEEIVVHDAKDDCWSWLDCIRFDLTRKIVEGPAGGYFTLEAESAELTTNGGQPVVDTNEAASEGKYVHDIGLNQGYATLTVPEDAKRGTYKLVLGYSSATNGTVSITVNGEEKSAEYTKTVESWSFVPNTVAIEGVRIHGGDKIVIHDALDSCWIWADYLKFELTKAAEEDPTWGVFTLEAEDGKLIANGGTPAVGQNEAASEGKYVHDIGLNQGSVTLTVPTSEDAGLYQLKLVYSSNIDNGEVSVTVGEKEYKLNYQKTTEGDSWYFAPNTLVLNDVRLQGGEKIVVHDARDNCYIWLDCIQFRQTAMGLPEEEPESPAETESEPESSTEAEPESPSETESEPESSSEAELENPSETESEPESSSEAETEHVHHFVENGKYSWINADGTYRVRYILVCEGCGEEDYGFVPVTSTTADGKVTFTATTPKGHTYSRTETASFIVNYNNQERTYTYGSIVELTADVMKKWYVNGAEEAAAIGKTYSFVVKRDMIITTADAEEAKPAATLRMERLSDNTKVLITLDWAMPSGYKLVKAGVYRGVGKDAEALKKTTPVNSSLTSTNGSMTAEVKLTSDAAKAGTITAIGYITYKDPTGKQNTIYTSYEKASAPISAV